MTAQDFGEKLRRHRERLGVSLESIAASTKISRWLLAALEEGNCSRWPSGLYSRAYIRAYAAAVDLDPEELVVEFAEIFPGIAWPDGPFTTERGGSAIGDAGFEPRTGSIRARGFARGTA